MINNLDKIVAVSGLPGLYLLESTRSDGLILKDPTTGKTNFVPARKHQFTPLKSIAIYTYGDSTPFEEIVESIDKSGLEINFVSLAKASNSEVLQWFRKILPEFDEDRVYHSDVRKVIKWYNFLQINGFLAIEVTDENTGSEEE